MCEIKCGRILCYSPEWTYNCCLCPILKVPVIRPGVPGEYIIVLDHSVPLPTGWTVPQSFTQRNLWDQLKTTRKIFCNCPKVVDCWRPQRMHIKIPLLSSNGDLSYKDLNINPYDLFKQNGTIKVPAGTELPQGGQAQSNDTRVSFFDIFTDLYLYASDQYNTAGGPFPHPNYPNPVRFLNGDATSDQWVDLVVAAPLPGTNPRFPDALNTFMPQP